MVKMSKLMILTLSFSIMVMLGTSAIAEETTDASWHQFHKDVEHSGFSPSTAPVSNTILWNTTDDIDAIRTTSVVVAEGKVFVNCNDGYLRAIDSTDGSFSWEADITGTGSVKWDSWATPAYNDGMIFSTLGKYTRCLDASSGDEIWNFSTSENSCNGGPMIVDGKVYVEDWNGCRYYCLDEYNNGTEIWNFSVFGTPGSGGESVGGARAQGSAAYKDGYVYLTSWYYHYSVNGTYEQGYVYCVDADTGVEEWRTILTQNACGSVSFGDEEGVCYVTTYNFDGNGALYAIDTSNGSILWETSIARTDCTPTYAYGNLYIAGGYQSGRLYCYNATTGDMSWSTRGYEVYGLGDWTQSVAVADGVVFTGAKALYPTIAEDQSYFWGFDCTYAVDAYTGDILWKQEGGGASPAIFDGTVYTIDNHGSVYAYGGGDESIDVVPSIECNSQAYKDVPLTIGVTVSNVGSTFTGDSVDVSLEVDGTEIDTDTIDFIGGGCYQSVSFEWIPTSTGAFSVEATVVTSDDADTSNDADSVTVAVTEGEPEIIPTAVTPDHIYVNQPYEMTAIISNEGADIADSFDVTIKEGTTEIASGTITSLYPGEDTEFTFMWTASSSGTTTLTVVVDYTGGTVLDDFAIDVEPETSIETFDIPDWPQFQKSWLHNGTVEDYAAKEAILKWDASEFNGSVDVSPIVVDDTVYVIASSGSLCAYEKYSGTLTWKKETELGTIVSSTPAYGDGNIFAASCLGTLYAFDAEDGAKQWEVKVTNESLEMPITYYDHRIYIGDGPGSNAGTKYFYCYDDLGNYLWSYANYNSSGFIWDGAVVVGDYVVYPTYEGILVCLDRVTGELVDEIDLSSSSDISFARSTTGVFRSSLVFNDGYLYITSESGQFYGFLWKIGFDEDSGAFIDEGWSVQQGFSTSTPAILGDRIYVGQGEHGETGALNCFDTSGNLLWSYTLDEGVKSSPVVVSDSGMTFIYFSEAAEDGSLYCLVDMDDHAEEVWEYNPDDDDGYILQGVAISDGLVFFGTGERLYCVEGDWNPWNDISSTNGEYISIEEVVEAYNCWRFSNPATGTGSSVSIESVVEMYNAWRFNNLM
jgi:outer membrane protein assembly factor BamB